MRVPPRTKAEGAVLEVRLEDRFDHQQHRHLRDAVPHRRNPQRAEPAIRLRNVDAAHRLRTIRSRPQRLREVVEKRRHATRPRSRWRATSRHRLPARPDSSAPAATPPPGRRAGRCGRTGCRTETVGSCFALRPSFHRSRETRTGRSASGTKPSAFQSVMERRSLKRLSSPAIETCVKSGPFAPRALPRFLATMSRSDSRPWPVAPLWIPDTALRRRSHAPRRVSQDPRPLCRRAPSPTTPDDSVGASARCFPTDDRLHHLGRLAAATGVTRPNRVRLRWAHVFALPVARPAARPPSPDRSTSRRVVTLTRGPELHGERAIHMADTSQSARVDQVDLAAPEIAERRETAEVRAKPAAPQARAGVTSDHKSERPGGSCGALICGRSSLQTA